MEERVDELSGEQHEFWKFCLQVPIVQLVLRCGLLEILLQLQSMEAMYERHDSTSMDNKTEP